MKGRKPTPTNVLKFRGSKQAKGRDKEPKPPIEMPSAPAWICGDAKREWARLTNIAEKLGYISKLDRSVLAMHCEALGQFIIAKREGDWRRMRDWADRVVKFGAELGLTPVSRARCKTSSDVGKKSDSDRFVKFG